MSILVFISVVIDVVVGGDEGVGRDEIFCVDGLVFVVFGLVFVVYDDFDNGWDMLVMDVFWGSVEKGDKYWYFLLLV